MVLPFSIAPNPNGDHLMILMNENSSLEVYELVVYAATGQLVYRDTDLEPVSKIINKSKYVAGFYFLELKNKKGKAINNKIYKRIIS